MGETIKIGHRVYFETENNGPIHRGEVIEITGSWATIQWDDGLQPTPISTALLTIEND